MTRLRLISVLMAALALGGASAGPSRVCESTRFVVSIVSQDDTREHRTVEIETARPPIAAPAVSIGTVHAGRRGSAHVTHSLFQRPPPPGLL